MHKLLIPFLLFFNSHLFAIDKKFNPEHAFSDHAGCPDNSKCNSKTGKLRQKLIDLLKKKNYKKVNLFIKENGYPVPVWTNQNYENETGLIRYSSRCPRHKSKEFQIFESSIFSKNIRKLDGETIIRQQLFILGKDVNKSMYAFRNEIPIKILKNGIGYNLDIDGHYFSLKLFQDGSFKMGPVINTSDFPVAIGCPKELPDKIKETFNHEQVFNGISCYRLYNKKLKASYLFVLGRGCI
jgi:hypothetical protein